MNKPIIAVCVLVLFGCSNKGYRSERKIFYPEQEEWSIDNSNKRTNDSNKVLSNEYVYQGFMGMYVAGMDDSGRTILDSSHYLFSFYDDGSVCLGFSDFSVDTVSAHEKYPCLIRCWNIGRYTFLDSCDGLIEMFFPTKPGEGEYVKYNFRVVNDSSIAISKKAKILFGHSPETIFCPSLK